ncbi:MAG: anion permease [Dethiobacter sp.]|nr:anion permease [Dethiobacter sp.]
MAEAKLVPEEKKQRTVEGVKWICLTLLAVLFIGIFSMLQPVSGLGRQGHWAVGCIAITLAAWIIHPERLPRGVAGVLMMGLLLAGNLSYGDVFYGFTTSAVWIIIPAFLFGYVIQHTGLGRRITVRMLNRCRGNIVSTAFALMLTGIIFSLLTPSTTVRVAIVMPIVLSIVRTLKLKVRSRESAFITLAAYTAILIPGNGWMTGSLIGPISMGLLPPALRTDLDWFGYSRALIFPWGIIAVLLFAYLFLVFRPWQFNWSVSYSEIELPPVSRQEVAAGIVLSLCFLGYLTTPLHGLESATITAISLFLLFATGTLNAGAISAGVNWEVVLFFGSILSVGRILESVGLTAILGEGLFPLVMRFAGNVTLFIYFMIAVTLVLRFVDAAWGLATIAVLFAFAPALNAAGIHPVVLCFLNGVIQYFTFLQYMSPFAIMSDNILEHEGWTERHLVIYGLGYLLCVALVIVPTVWYWRLLGFF